jgi:hypothetical protein
MFTAKKTKLFDSTPVAKGISNGNSFVTTALKEQAVVRSENGAKKYDTTGQPFVDQFAALGTMKTPRAFAQIEKDCEILWAEDRDLAIRFIFFLRMIVRKVQFVDGSTTTESQKGAELKHESIMRMLWLSKKDNKAFKDNLVLFTSVGSWKDIIVMLQYDLIYHGWENKILDWDFIGRVIVSGLNNTNTVNLIKKYLPQIKAKSACKTVESQADTMIGKWICSIVFNGGEKSSNYKQYRLLKSSGTAHQWQQLISQKKHNLIDFSKVHGRALRAMVKGKFLKNQGLETKYASWIGDPKTKDVKYTGFVHELFEPIANHRSLSSVDSNLATTIDKQFDTLVTKAKDNGKYTKYIVVRDTSGSMGSVASGTKLSCNHLAKSLALYFSEFLEGEFASNWIEFNSTAKMHTWKGKTVTQRWFNDVTGFVGSTNFLSVANLLCDIKKKGVKEEDFPRGIICISDGEFNGGHSLSKTNVEHFRTMLKDAGFSKDFYETFTIVLWDVAREAKSTKFETYGGQPYVYYFGGFSAATVAFLCNTEIKTPMELFMAAMDQEAINAVIV